MIRTLVLIVVLAQLFVGCAKQHLPRTTDQDDLGVRKINEKSFPNYDFRKKQFSEFSEYLDNIFLYPELRAHPEGRGCALAIGINEDNCSKTTTLSKSKDEANKMKRILESSGYAVKILTDNEATKQNILEWLAFFASISRTGDTIIIYYSGHGTTLEKCYKKLDGYVKKEILYDFYIIPYQESKFASSAPVEKPDTLVGSHELSRILKKSNFSVKVLLFDACSAHGTIIHPPSPALVYHYELKRQGYLFSCMLKEVIQEGQFSPLIFQALKGGADTERRIGNGDGCVSMFELINFVDKRWKEKYGEIELVHHGMTSTIYCASDIPLTIAGGQ